MLRSLVEAQQAVLEAMTKLPVEAVPLDDALGLVLAADVVAPHDVPPFANSAMDGFAVIAADTATPPSRLRILEDVPAGSVATMRVTSGTAIKIMTGAPMPVGADAVVMVEETSSEGRHVVVRGAVGVGTAVRDAGGDLASGALVFAEGVRLTATHLGVLASIGVAAPFVGRRPRVAVISTGDELVALDVESLVPGAIRDSNRPTLRGLLGELGAEVLDYGIVPDDAAALRETLADADDRADAVLTSGGVSMGEYDLVKQVLTELGDIDFWKVSMQPAKPFAFGALAGGTPLFGLPGNPVSVVVAFEQFVRPALLYRMGATLLFRPLLTGTMGVATNTNPDKTVFVRVGLRWGADGWVAEPSAGQLSNMLTALARSDAFAVVPVGVGFVEAGDPVDLEMFRWPETRTLEEAIGG